jgi:hypothetical protein
MWGFCKRDYKSTHSFVGLRFDRCTSVDISRTGIRRPVLSGFLLLRSCRDGSPSRALLVELATTLGIPDILIYDITSCYCLAETPE